MTQKNFTFLQLIMQKISKDFFKLCGNVFLLFFILSIFFFSPLYFFPQAVIPQTSFFYIWKNKCTRLKQAISPKIVCLGGSNLAFGLDSHLIQKELSYEVVNMGLMVGLGLVFLTKEIEDFVKAGDIIVFSPEYLHFFGSETEALYGNKTLSILLVNAYQKGLENLSFKQCLYQIPYFCEQGIEKVKHFITRTILGRKHNKAQKKLGPYQIKAFNFYQEIDSSFISSNLAFNAKSKIHAYEEINQQVVSFLVDYAQRMQEKNIQVFFSFPPFYAEAYDEHQIKIDRLYTHLQNQPLTLLSSPKRYRFVKEYMFDSIYHLNNTGRRIRSKYFIEDLKKQIVEFLN